MVTKCIREPYMILGPFLMLFQTVPLGCSASDTITHTIVGTITVTFAKPEPNNRERNKVKSINYNRYKCRFKSYIVIIETAV